MAAESDDLNLACSAILKTLLWVSMDANIAEFNIQLVMERLLLKGSLVVKKAYCDWERYKQFKPVMHDASFELIEIPHTAPVTVKIPLIYAWWWMPWTFAIPKSISIPLSSSVEDSDFSPLVSKLRENDKLVIGVGVKNSTSDLLMHNCDEFIFYDDLDREEKSHTRRKKKNTTRKAPAREQTPKKTGKEDPIDDAINLVLETAEALYTEQGDRKQLWGSMIKQTLKRRHPGFNERFYGVRSFSDLLEEAENRGLLQLESDERSGGYIIKSLKES